MKQQNWYLDDDAVELFELVRRDKGPGTYTLSQLFGDVWELILDKTNFGKRFRRSVDAGQLSGIVRTGRTVTNHQVYTVYAS